MSELGTSRWVAVDLEATCWAPDEDPALAADQWNECETIEIGAVRIDPVDRTMGDAFRAVIRPRRHPRLSAFCTRLTGLEQAEVDAAPPFPEVYAAFLDWLGGDANLTLASWGAWDDRQLRRDAARWDLEEPRWKGCNVKRLFARSTRGTRAPRGGWMGLGAAVAHLGGTFLGTPHRALDDARNVAWILSRLDAGAVAPSLR